MLENYSAEQLLALQKTHENIRIEQLLTFTKKTHENIRIDFLFFIVLKNCKNFSNFKND
jgi:hypothetical protein